MVAVYWFQTEAATAYEWFMQYLDIKFDLDFVKESRLAHAELGPKRDILTYLNEHIMM